MKSANLIRMARDRAGLSQEQLALRSGRPRSTIARWESGARSPSLGNLAEVVDAAGLELVVGLAETDRSFDGLIEEQLSLGPVVRLDRLLPRTQADQVSRALESLAHFKSPFIIIGPLAASLQGGPQRPREEAVEIVAGDRAALMLELERIGARATDDQERFADHNRRWRWTLPDAGTVTLVDRLSGAADYPDLRRSAVDVKIGELQVQVAHVRDLLRLAEASPQEANRAYVPGLRALLDRIP